MAAALTVDLAFVSTGYDEPYAPAGTAQAVRDAVRPYVAELLNLWGSGDQGLDMALVGLSLAFPVESETVVSPLHGWFRRSEPPLRTALGLALGFHSSGDDAAKQIIDDEIGQSILWVVRSDHLISYPPKSTSPRTDEEPHIDSSLPEAIHTGRRLQAGDEEQTVHFAPIFSLLLTLMDHGAGPLIEWPA